MQQFCVLCPIELSWSNGQMSSDFVTEVWSASQQLQWCAEVDERSRRTGHALRSSTMRLSPVDSMHSLHGLRGALHG